VSLSLPRSLVLVICWGLAGKGVIGIALGLVATSQQQGYQVTYPLLLGGTLAFVIFAPLTRFAMRSYEERELRRMAARDR